VALVDELPYEPWRQRGAVVAGEFRWRLGVHPLDLADWIEFGTDSDGPDGWIAEKPGLNADHRDQVFVALDDAEPECREVSTALADHLATHHPSQPHTLDPDLHPLDAAAHLVAEDLTVLVERDGQTVFGAGSVCFPNRWDLPSKLGHTLREVHEPVAQLNEQLAPAVDAFVDRLTPERSYWRLGWGIIDVPDGFAPPRHAETPASHDPRVDDTFVRVERETLRRFPETNCILFTIRTYVAPTGTVLADADSGAALSNAVAAMSPSVRAYKDLDGHGLDAVGVRPSGDRDPMCR